MRDPESDTEIPPFPIEELLSSSDREAIKESAEKLVTGQGEEPVYLNRGSSPDEVERLTALRGSVGHFLDPSPETSPAEAAKETEEEGDGFLGSGTGDEDAQEPAAASDAWGALTDGPADESPRDHAKEPGRPSPPSADGPDEPPATDGPADRPAEAPAERPAEAPADRPAPEAPEAAGTAGAPAKPVEDGGAPAAGAPEEDKEAEDQIGFLDEGRWRDDGGAASFEMPGSELAHLTGALPEDGPEDAAAPAGPADGPAAKAGHGFFSAAPGTSHGRGEEGERPAVTGVPAPDDSPGATPPPLRPPGKAVPAGAPAAGAPVGTPARPPLPPRVPPAGLPAGEAAAAVAGDRGERPAPGALDSFADRRVGLVLLGTLFVLLGALNACRIAFEVGSVLAIGPTPPALVGAGADGGPGWLVPRAAWLGGVSALFVTVGFGLMFARRWARTLALVAMWVWMLKGLLAFVLMMVFFAPVSEFLAGRVAEFGGVLPPGDERVAVAAVAGLDVLVNVFFPGLLILCLSAPNVRATCERFDLRRRWTDTAPLAVWIFSGLLAMGAVVAVAAALRGYAFPHFTGFTGGVEGSVAFAVLALVLAVLAVASGWRRPAGWWAALVAVLGATAMLALPFFIAPGADAPAPAVFEESIVLAPLPMGVILASVGAAMCVFALAIRRLFRTPKRAGTNAAGAAS